MNDLTLQKTTLSLQYLSLPPIVTLFHSEIQIDSNKKLTKIGTNYLTLDYIYFPFEEQNQEASIIKIVKKYSIAVR